MTDWWCAHNIVMLADVAYPCHKHQLLLSREDAKLYQDLIISLCQNSCCLPVECCGVVVGIDEVLVLIIPGACSLLLIAVVTWSGDRCEADWQAEWLDVCKRRDSEGGGHSDSEGWHWCYC